MAAISPQPLPKSGIPTKGQTSKDQKDNTEKDKGKKNIFAMPLEKQKRGKMEMRKKNYTKSYIFLAIALVFLVPYSIMFLYPQVTSYLAFNQVFGKAQEEIEELEVTISEKEDTRDTHKSAYDKEFAEEVEVIDSVFPETTAKLEVVRLMEDFATLLDTKYGDFEFTSISFQQSKEVEGKVELKDEDSEKKKTIDLGYTVLPFQTSIHASQKNFDRFLAFIDLSGDTDPNSKDHIRLMEIVNVSINYRGPDKTGKDQGVDFSVQLNAYSQ
jgi:hypothetical protein